MSGDERVARLQRALAAMGVPDAGVEAAGHEREIAAIRVPAAAWGRVMEEGLRIAALVTEAGFRYAALDLRPADGPE
ncbi:MAG TPA: hypothetical protein VEW03_16320 [Longimicrobiaceae bacterium]|nr:hypothetical protein [Longimicrobiaceae bacterium]